MKHEVNKLIETYKQHGKIVVGVDFDDTVFPYTNSKFIEDRCKKVRELLLEIKEMISICLYTVSDEQTLKYKHHIMIQYGLDPDFINDSPVSPWKGSKKLFFNILLDDKAGLNETIEILTEFKNYIK
jgi:hypothetical protein